VRARAGAESTVMTLACGEGGSRITALCDIGSGGGTSREEGEARALAGGVLASVGVERGHGTVREHGGIGAEQRKTAWGRGRKGGRGSWQVWPKS
jgi:hypothetical protein